METVRIQHGEKEALQLKTTFPEGVCIPWIQYMKISDHQYLELFYSHGVKHNEFKNPKNIMDSKK